MTKNALNWSHWRGMGQSGHDGLRILCYATLFGSDFSAIRPPPPPWAPDAICPSKCGSQGLGRGKPPWGPNRARMSKNQQLVTRGTFEAEFSGAGVCGYEHCKPNRPLRRAWTSPGPEILSVDAPKRSPTTQTCEGMQRYTHTYPHPHLRPRPHRKPYPI